MYDLINTGLQDLIRLQRKTGRTKRLRLSKRFRGRIFWRDNGKCVYCARDVKFSEATIDHVIPLVRKGPARQKCNIATACTICNQEKGPLVMDTPDDLSPSQLDLKFVRVTEDAKKRKGKFREWINSVENAAR